MNIFDVRNNSFNHRVGSVFNHVVSVVGFIIFWTFMFALLTCPTWLPALVDKIH
jgi:hypothetical protein